MTNEMISVSRDTLQKWLDDIGPSRHVTQYAALKRADLRALLAKPASQSQGEPWRTDVSQFLADAMTAAGMVRHGKQDKKFAERLAEECVRVRSALFAEQSAPVVVAFTERSPKDYAIEHAEFMATSADDVLAKFQAYGLALVAVDEGGDDGEDELFEAIDSARSDLQVSLVDLRGMVYEFRKRCSRLNPSRQVKP